MTKKLILIISTSLLIGLIVGHRVSKRPTPIGRVAEQATIVNQADPQMTTVTPQTGLKSIAQSIQENVKNETDSTTTVHATDLVEQRIFLKAAQIDEKTVLAQIQQNPEETPQAVLDFAMDLAPIMMRSLKDGQLAGITFSELEKCYENRSSIAPVRALCFGNMKRLSLRFPNKIASDFSLLSATADSEIKSFADQIVR